MHRFVLLQTGPWYGVRKKTLLESCRETGWQPRPNWEHPSHREFLTALSLVEGYEVVGEREADKQTGAAHRYQTKKSWTIRAGNQYGIITWDTEAGDVSGRLKGSVWSDLVDKMPLIISNARDLGQVTFQNLPDQVALMLMDQIPAAPYVRGLNVLVEEQYAQRVIDFHRLLGQPVADGDLITDPHQARAMITDSLHRGQSRLARSGGWLQISENSHWSLAALTGE